MKFLMEIGFATEYAVETLVAVAAKEI